MKKYYYIVADDTLGSDFIYLNDETVPDELKYACKRSEFQYIDKTLKVLEIDPDCGDLLPDFIYDERNYIPLISDRLKNVFDMLDVRNVYYQRVSLLRKKDGITSSYWIAVPPRIECMDKDKSTINTLWDKAEQIVIDEHKVGNYDIFKLSNVINNEIIISLKMKNAIEKADCSSGYMIFDDESLI